MLDSMTVQNCLPPLASAFCLPSEHSEYPAKIDRIIAGGEYAVGVVFPRVREALAHDSEAYDPLDMESLRGVVGTGITLLEAILSTHEERSIDAEKCAKLRNILEEYKNLSEDIELFSSDITTMDCLIAAGTGVMRPELESAEEDAAWRNL